MTNNPTPTVYADAIWQLAIDALQIHVAVVDNAGYIIAVNEPWRSFAAGNGVAHLEQATFHVNYLEVLPRVQQGGDPGAGNIRHGLTNILEGKSANYEQDYSCSTRGGALSFHIRIAAVPGAQACAVIAHEHITTPRRCAMELQMGEGKFQAMFEKHDAVMLLIEPSSGIIVDANRAAQKFYGYSREQLKWMNIAQINRLPPEEVAERRKQAVHENLNTFVFPHRLANGDVHMVEVHSSPVKVNNSTLLFLVIHDVTNRVQAVAELRQSEENNRAVLGIPAESLFLISLPDTFFGLQRERSWERLITIEQVIQQP